MVCSEHGRALVTGGGQRQEVDLPVCQETNNRPVHHLDRELATRMVCEKVAELLRGDATVINMIIGLCQDAAEGVQRPDEGRLKALRKQSEALTRKIGAVHGYSADTDEDVHENQR